MKTISKTLFCLVFFLSQAVLWPCWGKTDKLFDKKSNAKFGEIQIGFGDRVALSELPTPLSLRLKNPYKEKTEFTVRLRSEGRFTSQDFVKTLLVDANSEKLVRGNLRIHDEVEVEISVGSEIVFSEKYVCDSTNNASRRVLVVFGEEAKVKLPDTNSGGGFFLTSIASEDLPYNVACLCAFDIIIVQGTDPNTWSSEQKQALDLYIKMGGCVVLSHVQAKDLGVLNYWKSIDDEEHRRRAFLSSEMQVNWKLKRQGSGLVLLCSNDLVRGFLAKQRNKLEDALPVLASSVGTPNRPYFPLHYTENNRESGSHFSEWLMVIFFISYIVILGPIVAIAYRRSSRLKLAKAVVIVVLGFIVLSPAIGVTIRNASATLQVFSVIEIDSKGRALQSSEYMLISGGGKSYDIDVKGSKRLVGFVPTPDANWNQQRYSFFSPWGSGRDTLPVSSYELTTNLDGTLSLKDLPISPWERYSFYTMDQPEIPPLEVKVQLIEAPDVFALTLKNNTKKMLERVVFGAKVLGSPRNRLVAPKLPPGKTITQRVSLSSVFGNDLTDLISYSYNAEWSHWDRVPTHHQAWIAAKVTDSSFAAEGSRITHGKHRTLWIQGCDVMGIDRAALYRKPDAYLGLIIEERDNYRRGYYNPYPRIISVIEGSPADNAGVKAGDFLMSVQGKSVMNQPELLSLLRSYKPGQRISMSVRGKNSNKPKTRIVRLGKRVQ